MIYPRRTNPFPHPALFPHPARIIAIALILGLGLALAYPATIALAAPAGQSANLPANSKEPITIEADQGIEWRKKQKVYIARGNARAARGDVAVQADTLTAHYRETDDGKTDVWMVVADGHVLISTKDQRIEGDRGIYNVETGVFVLTGETIKMQTPNETVTAREKLEYDSKKRIARVVGDATAIREDKKIKADRFVAQFFEDESGELNLEFVRAVGNVVIETAGEIARADRGVYNASTEIATLTGSVKLTRGENQLNGDRAEVDLKNGVSRLLANTSGGGRVRGLFVPGNNDGGPGIQLPQGLGAIK
jgi:lipopolysaccharide export system protein LptA